MSTSKPTENESCGFSGTANRLRWSRSEGKRINHPQVEAFLAELTEVCRKHNLSLSHEDTQGAFVIEGPNDTNLRWLNDASIGKSVKT